MGTKARTFNGDPRIVSRFQPHVVPWPLCRRGPVIGINIVTKQYERWHPWELRQDDRISSYFGRDTGDLGSGKTGGFTIMACRMLEMAAGNDANGNPKPMRGRLEEDKRKEGDSAFREFAEVMHADIVVMDRQANINIWEYSPEMREVDMLIRVLRTCEVMNGGEPLPSEVEYAIQVAVFIMMKHPEQSGPGRLYSVLDAATIEDDDEYRKHLQAQFASEQERAFADYPEYKTDVLNRLHRGETSAENVDELMNATRREQAIKFKQACEVAKRYPHKLKFGELSNVFGDGIGLSTFMAFDVGIIDWFNVQPMARAIITSAMWHEQMMSARTPEGLDLMPNFVFTDEAAKSSATIKTVVEFQVNAAKDSRAYPTLLLQAAQFEVQDLLSLGEPGSRLRGLAQSLAQNVGFRNIYSTGPMTDEMRHFYAGLGIHETDIEFFPALPTGVHATWIPGEPIRYIQRRPTSIEWPMIQSDGAAASMTAAQHVWTIQEIADRAVTRLASPSQVKPTPTPTEAGEE